MHQGHDVRCNPYPLILALNWPDYLNITVECTAISLVLRRDQGSINSRKLSDLDTPCLLGTERLIPRIQPVPGHRQHPMTKLDLASHVALGKTRQADVRTTPLID
jgi:hypothetical protein